MNRWPSLVAVATITSLGCQLLLDTAESADASTTDANADGGPIATEASIDGEPSGPLCGLAGQIISYELEGAPSLLVSDGDGAYFVETLGDGGSKISSIAALRDGGAELRSVVLTSGGAVKVLWPDKSKPTFLRYVVSGPGGHFFKYVTKNLQTLDDNYTATPNIVLYGPTEDRLFLVEPNSLGAGVIIAAATPDIGYQDDPIATVTRLSVTALLSVTGDSTAAYGATKTEVLRFVGGVATTLSESPDGRVGPSGPLAVKRGVVYWIAGGDVFAVDAIGGAPAPLATKVSAEALAVDDACVHFASSDGALMAVPRNGGSAKVVSADAGKVSELAASDPGVFWTTSGVRPRAYAMLRPIAP